MLQHLLAGHRQSSSLGCRGVSVALDGLRVGAPEDGREQGGAQRGEIWKQDPVMTQGEEGGNNQNHRRNDQTSESEKLFG